MSNDLNKDPEFDVLIEALAKKTREGKLRWEETAEENKYLAAVKGIQTFEISHRSYMTEWSQPDTVEETRLIVRGEDGRVLLDHTTDYLVAYNLFKLAQRVAMRVDDRIDASLQLLNGL
jgi:hypothetical protein